MTDLYRLSTGCIVALSTLSALCATVQAIATAITINRFGKTGAAWLSSFLEALILFQCVIFALMISRILANIKVMLIAPAGHAFLQYALALCICVTAAVLCAIRKKAAYLLPIPFTALTLPATEAIFGAAFPFILATSLIFWLVRATIVCVVRRREISSELSALTIKQATDSLRTGLLYFGPNGTIYLVNHRMQSLMVALTGAVQRNGVHFRKTIFDGSTLLAPEPLLLDGQRIYRLYDGSAWLFREQEIFVSGRKYFQLSAADVTERWLLTLALQKQTEELRLRGKQLSSATLNIDVICREEELLRLRSKVHDSMAQCLAMLMRVLRSEETIDEKSLASFADDMLKTAREEIELDTGADGIHSLRRAYETMGVDVELCGAIPSSPEHAAFFADYVKEATANAVRHGFATKVKISCENAHSGVAISIANNGFVPNGTVAEGSGISELRRKLSRLGGKLEIDTGPPFKLTACLVAGCAGYAMRGEINNV